jgi:DNA polymerase I-like protein with 3'-5' exonuclease and polymerase domains
MGNVALRRICGLSGINAHQCYVHDTPYGIPAIPTFHPSFVMQDQLKLTPIVLFAFRKALEIAKSGSFQRTPVDYCLDRPLPEMEQWMADLGYTPDMPLAVDIETPETDKINEEDSDDPEKTSFTIIRCGFSFRVGTAVSYPWTEPYISFTRSLLSKSSVTIFHNAGFDCPRLVRARCIPQGRVIDTMWMFHFLQSDLPKSLEFVAPFYTDVAPWKHLSQAEPAFYNATDNDVTLRCYYAMREWLVRQGRWERFLRHCSDTAEILGEMSTAGVLIDVEARSALQNGLRAEIATLDSTIQAAVPRELLPVEWLKTDRAFTRTNDPQDREGWEPVEVPCECKRLRKSTGRCLLCDDTKVITHYRKLLPFNWNSTEQAQDLARHYGFTIPKKRGEDREALESKTLRKFGKRKPVFLDIWNARKRYKLISTYNWATDEGCRVHGTFGFWPSTWRKAMRDPNLMTIPTRNELAAAFKRTIIAAPGCVLISADSSAIEAVIVGYCANSPRYVRAAKAGIHDIFMSHVRARKEGGKGINVDLPDAELIAACKAAKKEDKSRPVLEQIRDACKRVIHGTNYGLSAFGMHDEYPDEFPTERVARELQDMYLDLFPEIKRWMRTTRELADRQTYLDNHYQYRHYFYAVTKWNSKYQRFDLGTDAKRCIAFLPQSDASAIQTEDLLTLAEHPDVRTMLRLIIHDSHVLECPIGCIPDVCDMLYRTMSRPRPELGGLEIGVEIKVGENLCDTSTWSPHES